MTATEWGAVSVTAQSLCVKHLASFTCSIAKMCGGWACASYDLACNNPPLSTVRFTGRDFVPTPCGPYDRCWVRDTSRKNSNNCYVPHDIAPPCPPERGGPRQDANVSECK